MTIPFLGTSTDGRPMHYSVGALIKRDDTYLLIDRASPPFGFAGVAGHHDVGETVEQALVREVREESGLVVVAYRKLFEEEIPWNTCSKGIPVHHWTLYECDVIGELIRNDRETKAIGWYSQSGIVRLQLEPVWQYWFEKCDILRKG